MARYVPVLVVVALLVVAGATPALAAEDGSSADPDSVEIVSLNGEDADQVNEFAVRGGERIHVELAGLDTPDRSLYVEVGGTVLGTMDEPEQDVRPRSDADVTTGEQTLRIVRDVRGNRTVLARTDVRVTAVDLDSEENTSTADVDPDAVAFASINGEDPATVNEFAVESDGSVHVELAGLDAPDRALPVEIGGTVVGSMDRAEQDVRFRTEADVTAGQQTMAVVWEDRGDRTVLARTDVRVTAVDLERDDGTLGFDPASVSLASVNGEAPADVDLAVRYNETIAIELDGVDVADHLFRVELGGEAVGTVGDGETAFRPRSDVDVEAGEQSLAVLARDEGEWTLVAERTVTVTDVALDRVTGLGSPIDPDSVTIDSVNGEPADRRNALELNRHTPLSVQVDAEEYPERGFVVEIGDATVGVHEESDGEFRIRRDADVATGPQTLRLVQQRRGNRTVVAETAVEVTAVNLGDNRLGVPPDEIDLEIESVNGQSAEGVVVTEQDLRGEIPVELTIDGLADIDYAPTVQYKNDTIPVNHDRYAIEEERLTIEHLRWVEEGEVANLALVYNTGSGEPYVFDSVRVEYRHADGANLVPLEDAGEGTGTQGAAESDSSGGILGGIADFLGGGGDSSESDDGSDAQTTTRSEDGGTASETTDRPTTESTESDGGGGVVSVIRELLGL